MAFHHDHQKAVGDVGEKLAAEEAPQKAQLHFLAPACPWAELRALLPDGDLVPPPARRLHVCCPAGAQVGRQRSIYINVTAIFPPLDIFNFI